MLPGHKAVIAFERYKYLREQITSWAGAKNIYIKELIDLLGLDCLGFILNDLSLSNNNYRNRCLLEVLEEMHNRDLIPHSPYKPSVNTKVPLIKIENQFQVAPLVKDASIEQIKQWAIEEGYYDE